MINPPFGDFNGLRAMLQKKLRQLDALNAQRQQPADNAGWDSQEELAWRQTQELIARVRSH